MPRGLGESDGQYFGSVRVDSGRLGGEIGMLQIQGCHWVERAHRPDETIEGERCVRVCMYVYVLKRLQVRDEAMIKSLFLNKHILTYTLILYNFRKRMRKTKRKRSSPRRRIILSACGLLPERRMGGLRIGRNRRLPWLILSILLLSRL